MDKVSVIVPVYNAEKHLCQCVDSLINQTLKDVEFIFVNDGSTDNSLNILYEYMSSDSRIKVITQENANAGVARNNGLNKATGEYVIFLDSDDFFDINLLDECYHCAKQTGASIVAFDYYRFDEITNTVINEKSRQNIKEGIVSPSRRESFYRSILGAPWNKFFLRDFVIRNNLSFQEISNTNDEYFSHIAMYLSENIYYIDKKYVYYRTNNTNSLQGQVEKALSCRIDCIIAIKKEVELRGIKDEVVLKDVDNFIDQVLVNLINKKYNFESISNVFEYTKARIVPNIYNKVSEIPKGSMAEKIYNNSLAEFMWILSCEKEQRFFESKTYKIGNAVLTVPREIMKYIKINKQ